MYIKKLAPLWTLDYNRNTEYSHAPAPNTSSGTGPSDSGTSEYYSTTHNSRSRSKKQPEPGTITTVKVKGTQRQLRLFGVPRLAAYTAASGVLHMPMPMANGSLHCAGNHAQHPPTKTSIMALAPVLAMLISRVVAFGLMRSLHKTIGPSECTKRGNMLFALRYLAVVSS
jgi:hypothetical protein